MSDPTKQFEALEINKALTKPEQDAIDALKIDNTNTPEILKQALQDEVIKGTNQTFLTMANGIVDYTIYDEKSAQFTFIDNAPDRLRTFVSAEDNNDFAYLLYKISTLLQVPMETGLEQMKLGIKTEEQLTKLKTEIEKKPITTPETGTTYTVGVEGIGDAFTKYGITKQQIQDAIGTLQDNLKKENKTTLPDGTTVDKLVTDYLKNGRIKELQIALGMKESAGSLEEKADGKFGPRTLKNLEAGKVTKGVAISKEQVKTGTNAPDLKERIDAETRANKDVQKKVADFLAASDIKGLQQYLYELTGNTMNSWKGDHRDGVLGGGTLAGINSVKTSDGILKKNAGETPPVVSNVPAAGGTNVPSGNQGQNVPSNIPVQSNEQPPEKVEGKNIRTISNINQIPQLIAEIPQTGVLGLKLYEFRLTTGRFAPLKMILYYDGMNKTGRYIKYPYNNTYNKDPYQGKWSIDANNNITVKPDNFVTYTELSLTAKNNPGLLASKYHVELKAKPSNAPMIVVDQFVPMAGYEFLDKDDPTNLATRLAENITGPTKQALDSITSPLILETMYHLERRGTPPQKILYYPVAGRDRKYPDNPNNYETIKE